MSSFSLILEVARTQMRTRRKQSIISALGVMFGIGMYIFMINFMMGTNDLMMNTMLEAMPHVRISPTQEGDADEDSKSAMSIPLMDLQSMLQEQTQGVEHGEEMLLALRKDKRIRGVSAVVQTGVFVTSEGRGTAALLAGVEPLEEDKLFHLSEQLRSGTISTLSDSSATVIIGAGLSRKLKKQVGDSVQLVAPTGRRTPVAIGAIFYTGVTALDDNKVYTHIAIAQRLLNKADAYYSEIAVKVNDLAQAKDVASDYSHYGNAAEDWESANAALLLSARLRNLVTYIVVIVLLIVAGFGIYNIMNMTIYEKMRDIAILKATGFSGSDIRWIFLCQSLLIGIAGGLLGVCLGFLVSKSVEQIPFEMDIWISMDHLPVNYELKYYVFGFLFGVLTTLVAGILPSRKAARLDPVAILRGQ